ncbi:acyltransferase family protein [Pseudomonas sp. B28(2017)]|uniref:acyltransferase family protein n=1 Tax=Pseudomonas sp. B28(2017) TaxID=1981730 RepID=UPI000A1F33D9|nr:acyltransferase family protein [Pseudomonas sp. B28(2017)]
MTSLSVDNFTSNKNELAHPKYRADIDGLRAIAILSVLVFHAFPTLLPGGFIGVDIFFVISGFLISTILYEKFEQGKFKLTDFYARRIKRIFPALSLILITCIALGWFTLLSDEYKQLGKHIAGGAGFISNLILQQESGYFDSSADLKPLLHLWSLGIEEQFYIFWPIVLWAGYKCRLNILAICTLILCASFTWNIYHIHSDPATVFYMPYTRIWELLIGAAVAYAHVYRKKSLSTALNNANAMFIRFFPPKPTKTDNSTIRNIASICGTSALFIGLVFINKDSSFPGWWAFLPTLGAALIISAGPDAIFNRLILSSRPMTWVGLISFPLYLWHWPILSFAHIFEGGPVPPTLRTAAVALSILLAWLTYKVIERPIRTSNNKLTTMLLLALMLLVGYSGYSIYKHNGFESRLGGIQGFSSYFENSLPEQKYFQKIDLLNTYRTDCDFYNLEKYRSGNATNTPRASIKESCYTKDATKNKTVFLWGDSHAQQLYSGMKNRLPSDWNILQITSSGCAASPSVSNPSTVDYCAQSNWFALETLKKTTPDVVVISQIANYDTPTIFQLSEKLKSIGVKRTVFVGPVPHWTAELPKIIMKSLWLNTPKRTLIGLSQETIDYNTALHRTLQDSGIVFADIINTLCNEQGCLTYLGEDKTKGITSWDYGHLTPIASDYIAKKLLVQLIINSESDTQATNK